MIFNLFLNVLYNSHIILFYISSGYDVFVAGVQVHTSDVHQVYRRIPQVYQCEMYKCTRVHLTWCRIEHFRCAGVHLQG